MQMVERTLKRKPDASNDELYEKAKEINSDIGDLSLRQFHARYPLQVKRRASSGTGKAKPKTKKKRAAVKASKSAKGKASGDRSAVRDTLLKLVKDVADAESKGEVVDVVAGLDSYVDRVLRAAGK